MNKIFCSAQISQFPTRRNGLAYFGIFQMKAEERRMAKIALSAFVHVEGANTRDCIHNTFLSV
jgi:hypothetical protein